LELDVADKRDETRSRPRVLRIITRMNIGGPATHVVLANRGLEDRGWDTLLAFGDVDATEAEVSLDPTINSVRIGGLRRRPDPVADTRAFGQLLKLIRSYRPDIVHTHLSKAGLLGRIAARISSPARRVHTFHGNVFDGYFSPVVSRTILSLERVLAGQTDAIVALSDLQRQELLDLRIGSPQRTAVIPLAIDVSRFQSVNRDAARASLGIPLDSLVVVAIGRMVPIKRLDRLIRAFEPVVATIPLARLFLIGDGPERAELEELTSSLSLQDKVTFVGWSADTPRWYGASDVVALTSAREGTPLALIEAAAAGKAAVATSVGGVPDVVENGVTGEIVNGDVQDIAGALQRLLLDRDRRDEMGRTALSRSVRYGAPRLGDDLDRLYRRLMTGAR
jgi:glycosyltransferase involved in cell wall biosynthesis